MRNVAITAALLLALLPLPAKALNTSDLIAFVEMPLAVDAVASVRGVDLVQLTGLCETLNEANVPPMVFVQELRYTPVALVGPALRQEPTLVTYVREQRHRGLRGYDLGRAMERRLTERYYVTRIVTTRTVYVDDDYIPPVIITRVMQYEPDPLAYIDMPLAVAEVYDRGYYPQDQFSTYVTSLNDAWVPPSQFIRVVRYAPSEPQFLPFVQTQINRGVTGMALIAAIDQRVPQIRTAVVQPGYAQSGYSSQPAYSQPAYTQPGYAQPVYTQPGRTPRSYVAPGNIQTGAVQNPHGGPPGQLKRTYGDQTGAEVVHGGVKPGHQFQPNAPAVIAAPREHGRGNGHGHGRGNAPAAVAVPQAAPVFVPHEHGNGNGHGRGHVNAPAPVAAPRPAPVFVPQGHGNGNGHGRGHISAPAAVAVPQPAPVIVPQGHGNGNGGGKQHGHGHGNAFVAAPAPAPVIVPQPVPQAIPPQAVPPQGHGHGPQGAGPPGQNGKGKGHGKG